jgi:hypothetical protein
VLAELHGVSREAPFPPFAARAVPSDYMKMRLIAVTRLKPAADDNVASKWRRVCLDCITVFSHLIDFLTPNAMFFDNPASRLREINTLK